MTTTKTKPSDLSPPKSTPEFRDRADELALLQDEVAALIAGRDIELQAIQEEHNPAILETKLRIAALEPPLTEFALAHQQDICDPGKKSGSAVHATWQIRAGKPKIALGQDEEEQAVIGKIESMCDDPEQFLRVRKTILLSQLHRWSNDELNAAGLVRHPAEDTVIIKSKNRT